MDRVDDFVAAVATAADGCNFICVTGKRPFPSKREARTAAGECNHKQRAGSGGRQMGAFRCGWCDKYHIGHRR